LDAALTETSDGLSLAVEKGSEPFELLGVGLKAVIQLLMKDITGAKESLSRADQIRRKQPFWGPWYLSSGVLAQFMFDLQLLRDAVAEKNRSAVSATAKAALKSGKEAVKKSAGFAAYRAWNYRLMGDYYWLVGKQRKAMKWYERSIQEGERLGARPDLSRTYLEVGRRLLEPQSKYKQLNGTDASGYFEKAETLFREMGLERDLEELERVRLEL
jgi:tetratricopeptide (TPR) repeat protein